MTNRHNPGGGGLGEVPRVELEARVLEAERRVGETLVAFRDLSERYRRAAAALLSIRDRRRGDGIPTDREIARAVLADLGISHAQTSDRCPADR